MSEKLDTVIIGGGFAGIYALYRLRKLGLETRVLEAGDDIGGTWHWNAYPGARCDVESFQYSYSFDDDLQQEWEWTERYASQPEILAYLKHVVDRYDLAGDIQCNSRVESADYDESSHLWNIKTGNHIYQARYLVMAVGCLSKPNIPAIPGKEDFQGMLVHTGLWPQEGIDLKRKRVGVIGTGSSGVQIIAEIAEEVDQLYVFQRTPHWVAMAGSRVLSGEEKKDVKSRYNEMRAFMQGSLLGMNVAPGERSALEASEEERARDFGRTWNIGGPAFLMTYNDLLVNPEANKTASDFMAVKIREIVKVPVTAEALIPDAEKYPLGGRRMVQDDRYYATYNRDNVTLVDTRKDPIKRITASGIKTAGNEYGLDVIILATGFDAVTGTLLNLDITGRNGMTLKDKWADGALTYLGVGMEGFPNLFTITGPGSPSVLSNMVLSIEQHVEWITGAIAWMEEQGFKSMEPCAESETAWAQRVIDAARPTVLFRTASWYSGNNINGKPKVFLPYLGGVGNYRKECDSIADKGYPGFITT